MTNKKRLISIFAALTIIVNVFVVPVSASIDTIPSVNRGLYRLYGSTVSSYYIQLDAQNISGLLYDFNGYPKTVSFGSGLQMLTFSAVSGNVAALYSSYIRYDYLGGTPTIVREPFYFQAYYNNYSNPKEIQVQLNSGNLVSYVKM